MALGLIPLGSWIRLAVLGGLLLAVLLPDGVWLLRTFWLRLLPVLGLTAGMGLLLLFTRKGGATWPLLDVGGARSASPRPAWQRRQSWPYGPCWRLRPW